MAMMAAAAAGPVGGAGGGRTLSGRPVATSGVVGDIPLLPSESFHKNGGERMPACAGAALVRRCRCTRMFVAPVLYGALRRVG